MDPRENEQEQLDLLPRKNSPDFTSPERDAFGLSTEAVPEESTRLLTTLPSLPHHQTRVLPEPQSPKLTSSTAVPVPENFALDDDAFEQHAGTTTRPGPARRQTYVSCENFSPSSADYVSTLPHAQSAQHFPHADTPQTASVGLHALPALSEAPGVLPQISPASHLNGVATSRSDQRHSSSSEYSGSSVSMSRITSAGAALPFSPTSASGATRAPVQASTYAIAEQPKNGQGVQLSDTVTHEAVSQQRQPNAPATRSERSGTVPASATGTATARAASFNRNRLGTTRKMSMRGKKATRIIKKRIINKTDAKSYFSNERTMYSWMYMGTVIVGIALSLYGYISIDPGLAQIGRQTGTVLSLLAVIIFFYAAYRFAWRRRALGRGLAATAFDDRHGAYIIGALVIAGLCTNIILAWINPIDGLHVRLHRKTLFVPGNLEGSNIHHDGTHRNPYAHGSRHRNARPPQSTAISG